MNSNKKTARLAGLLISLLTLSSVFAGEIDNIIALYKSGKLVEAKEQLQAHLARHPDDAEGLYYMGRIQFDEKQYKDAEKSLKKATKFDADNSDYFLWLGYTYTRIVYEVNFFKKIFVAKKIKKNFAKAVELDSANVNACESLIGYLLGAPGIAGGDSKKAEKLARHLIQYDDIRGRIAMAQVYEKYKRYELGMAELIKLEQAIGDSADFYGFYNTFGYFLLKQKRYEEAVQKFEKQVELAPDKANPYDSLGDGYRAVGRHEDAAAAYRKALEIDPELSASSKNLKKVEKELRKAASK